MMNMWSTSCSFLLQLVTYGDNREEALATMAKALDNYCIKGEPFHVASNSLCGLVCDN